MRHSRDTEPAVRRYHQHLLLTRLLFLVGCGLILMPALGLRLEPGGQSFSHAPEYAGDETAGVPLFQSIGKCPFCGLHL